MIDPELPVQSPEQFFGQRSLLRKIYARIGTERPQSVAVIGGAKTGKTSLLRCLAHESLRLQHLEQPERYRLLEIDAASAEIRDGPAFIGAVSRLLGEETAAGKNHYNALQKIVERHHAGGVHLILLLDDFHLITSNPSFPLEFFSFLRSLANNYNLAYVTTSFLELQKLCVVKDIEESPFFNIFTNLSLGPLAASEGIELLASLTGVSGGEVRSLAEWVGSFPYLLKLVARRLQEGRLDPKSLDPERDLLPELSPYFERILSLLAPDAFEPLRTIAKDKEPDPRTVFHLRPLIKQGFLVEKGAAILPFSPAFAAFLRKSLAKKMLQGKG